MRKYEIVYANGEKEYYEAEMDTLQQGAVILSRKKQYNGVIARTDQAPEIVRVISLANLRNYGYTEIHDA